MKKTLIRRISLFLVQLFPQVLKVVLGGVTIRGNWTRQVIVVEIEQQVSDRI